jgi:hypothetical protein
VGTKYIETAPRQKLQLPQAAWEKASRAMSGAEPMTTTATLEEMQAYQYRLARARREIEKEKLVLEQRKAAASASSR